jgi:hypothetical protein
MSDIHTRRTSSAHSIDLDPNIAAQLAVACERFLAELQHMAGNLNRLTALDCFGTLQSGRVMAGKFSQKATGGADSLEKSLLSHALVITEMRDFFQQCVDRYGEVDDSNASALASTQIPR